jgi:hypothetical protein
MRPQTKLLLTCIFASPLAATAQSVIAPRPSVPVASTYVQDQQAESGLVGSADSVLATLFGLQPYQAGPVTVRPHAVYRIFYSDGIQSGPGHQLTSIIQDVSPGLLFNIGSHWAVDYTPALTFYSNKQLHDTVDQAIRLNGGASSRDWSFTLNHSYESTGSTRVETARQTDQQTHSTELSAFHELNSKLALDLGLSQNIRLADQFTSSYEWATMDWINYYLGSRLNVGLGAGFGYDKVPGSVDMMFEQVQARVGWHVTDKISLAVNGGGEDRQFVNSSIPSLINPTYGATLDYRPFRYTGLSLTASRAVTQSFFQDQATENTSLSVALTQRLLKHFNASVTGGYNTEQYIATARGVSSGRHDTYYSMTTRLSWVLLKQFSMGLFYNFSENASTSNGFGYNSSQTGLEVGYRL